MSTVLFIIIVGLIVYIVYASLAHTKEQKKSQEIQKQLASSYDNAVRFLVSCYLHDYGDTKEARKEIRESCARAIVDAASFSIDMNSYMSVTDIMSMCTLFKRSFICKELDMPDGTIPEDEELEKLEKIVDKDIMFKYGK